MIYKRRPPVPFRNCVVYEYEIYSFKEKETLMSGNNIGRFRNQKVETVREEKYIKGNMMFSSCRRKFNAPPALTATSIEAGRFPCSSVI
jgi:hypothetical protein